MTSASRLDLYNCNCFIYPARPPLLPLQTKTMYPRQPFKTIYLVFHLITSICLIPM
jgi:hypothetical protein